MNLSVPACFAAFIVALWLTLPGSAWAHASLLHVEPADGTVVAEKPDAFRLTFNEPVSPLVLKLIAPDGSSVDIGPPSTVGNVLSIGAPAMMREGTYVLSWRVVSLDGHPVGGSILYSLGRPSAGVTAAANAIDWPVRSLLWLDRVAIYLGLFIGVGMAGYRALIDRPPPLAAAAALVLCVAGLVAVMVSIGLQGLDALGASLGEILHASVWKAGFATTYSDTAIFAGLALLLGIAALSLRIDALATVIGIAAIGCVGLALAASGHASTATPRWITRPAVFVHAATIAFWAGALLPLGLTLRTGGDKADRTLTRFSKRVPAAIVLLVLSGLTLAVVQIGSPGALSTTSYGRVLLAKAALLLLLFGLAAYNRWGLTKPMRAGDPLARRSLVRSIAVETVLVAAILGVVALWRFTPPPRALIEAAAPVEVHLHGDKAMALLAVVPGHVGEAAVSIAVMDGDGVPIDPKEVTLVLSRPEAGIEPMERRAFKTPDGVWSVDGLLLPLAGTWTVRVDILVSDFETMSLEALVDIRP